MNIRIIRFALATAARVVPMTFSMARKLSLAATLMMAALFLGRADAQQVSTNRLEGTWLATATFANPLPGKPPTFDILVTFYADGNLFMTSNLPNVTGAQGEWVRSGNNRFTYTFFFYNVNPQGGLLTKTRVYENLKLSDDGKEYDTIARIQALDSAGNVLTSVDAKVHGKRIELIPFDLLP